MNRRMTRLEWTKLQAEIHKKKPKIEKVRFPNIQLPKGERRKSNDRY